MRCRVLPLCHSGKAIEEDNWALSRHQWGKGKDKNIVQFREDVFTQWNTFGKGNLTGWRP